MLNNNLQIPPISANPGFTNKFNRSGKLQKITRHVVVYVATNQFDVYRQSTKKRGYFSREVYSKQKSGAFKLTSKDATKYKDPKIPEDAISYTYDGVDFYCMKSLSNYQLDIIRKLVDSVSK